MLNEFLKSMVTPAHHVHSKRTYSSIKNALTAARKHPRGVNGQTHVLPSGRVCFYIDTSKPLTGAK